MTTISIKPELLRVLAEIKRESFTVADLTEHYLSHPETLHIRKKPARQFIYRNMTRMIRTGLMEKLPEDGGWPRYKLTKCFSSRLIHESKKRATTQNLPKSQLVKMNGATSLMTASSVDVLRERLSKHRTDMLCALGETEEYESLCRDLPDLNDEAQALYNEARERSALLLGKIKALESLLSLDRHR